MELASLRELKQELATYAQDDLIKICLRLAKHKKEVKELLHYLCFEVQDQAAFVRLVQEEIETEFETVRGIPLYQAKKRIRKILRTVNKYIRFAAEKQTEAELRIFFCQQLLGTQIDLPRSSVLLNLYRRQVSAAEKAIDKLHPDLQFDFEESFGEISSAIPE